MEPKADQVQPVKPLEQVEIQIPPVASDSLEVEKPIEKTVVTEIESQQQPMVKQQDKRSVFVENVDYSATKEDLENIFCDCGKIVRVTILRDKFTNNPRGLAYVEFADVESVEHAIVLTGAELRNRFIRVSPKRTNIKGMAKPKKKTFGPADNANALIQGLLGMIKPGGRFKPKA